jgi:hypothetical protein
MIEPKDFAVGCLTIILCAILIPLLYIIFKLSLLIAIPLAMIVAMIFGIVILGRIIRLTFSEKKH